MAKVTLPDLSLPACRLTLRVERLRCAYFSAIPEVCSERALLLTEYHQEHKLLGRDRRITALEKARAYRHVLANRCAIVRFRNARKKGGERFEFTDESLFAGSTTGKFKGVPLYPEFLALTLWPELRTITHRAQNPYYLDEEDVGLLNRKVFPAWLDHSLFELARHRNGQTQQFDLYQQLVFFLASKPNCISHTIPCLSRAVNDGLRAIIDDAREHASSAGNPSQVEFYQAMAEALEGIVDYSHRLADEAEARARGEPDGPTKTELLELAHIHRRVPEKPAGTFREGLTTVWLCWIALHLENANAALSLGRLDQLLYDLYRQDIDAGTLSVQGAVELLGCLWLKIGDHVPTIAEAGEQLFGGTGSNQAITIGGVDAEGRDAVNDLTYVILRAIELMKLRDPNLNARHMAGVNPPEYLRRLCEANIRTGATPAIHNDRAIIHALVGKGDPLEHARDYGVVGCVEPCSAGRHYGHTGALVINLTSALELALFNGCHRHTGLRDEDRVGPATGDPGDFESWEQFRDAFQAQVTWLAEQAVWMNERMGEIHQDFYPTPLLSALFEGPMEKGKDLIDGGAVINSSGVTIIGLADVADSLSAIQRAVFGDKLVSFERLQEALIDDFEGDDYLRTWLMNPERSPKYGNEDKDADRNVAWIVELLDCIFAHKTNYRDGQYRVGYWTMTNHAGFGRLMGALPSGRRRGENFTSGITPVSRVTPWLTQTLNSVASVPSRCLSSGVALNIKFTPGALDTEEAMVEAFANVVEAYFDESKPPDAQGVEIQFNVIDHETLQAAAEHPGNYPDLLVRVSGYTAYFKDLNPQMQREIIERTEYSLANGAARFVWPFELPTEEV